MSGEPTALELADAIDEQNPPLWVRSDAVAMLRRQHAVIEALAAIPGQVADTYDGKAATYAVRDLTERVARVLAPGGAS